MYQTFFVIPWWFFDGRLTVVWLVVGFGLLLWQGRSEGLTVALKSFLPMYLVVAAIVHFLLPGLSTDGVNPQDPAGPLVPMGLAIRGYGVFLMLAILAAVGLVLERCRRFGLDADKIVSLCFWMVIIGILGARIFFVVQKFGSFEGASLIELLDMTKGGLVVYGSLVGGVVAALVCFWYSKLPVLETLDVLAPAMALGLAIGRIGCLMNGCCYGGPCSVDYPFGLKFPAGSTPYMEQLTDGSLLGLKTARGPSGESYRIVEQVEGGSIGAELGVSAGEKIAVFGPDPVRLAAVDWKSEKPSGLTVDISGDRSGTRSILVERVSDWSRPIHPTQIYASINAALLCWVLWLLSERRQFAGQVFAVLIVVYPVSRFMLEIIRQDEAGVFGTDLTISQWFSIFLLVGGCIFYIVLYSRYLRAGSGGVSLGTKI